MAREPEMMLLSGTGTNVALEPEEILLMGVETEASVAPVSEPNVGEETGGISLPSVGAIRLGRFTGFPFFFGFILKPVFFGLAFTKTGKPSLGNCLLSSPETRS